MAVTASAAPSPSSSPAHTPARLGAGRGKVTFLPASSKVLQLCSELTAKGFHVVARLYCTFVTFFPFFLPHSPLYISPLHIVLTPISYKKFMSLISLRYPLCITSKFLITHSASCVSQCCSRADLPWRSQQLLCLDTFFQVEAHAHIGWAGVLVVGGGFIIVYETSAVYKLFLLNVIIFSVA